LLNLGVVACGLAAAVGGSSAVLVLMSSADESACERRQHANIATAAGRMTVRFLPFIELLPPSRSLVKGGDDQQSASAGLQHRTLEKLLEIVLQPSIGPRRV
jgi:hypothetical protein